MFPDKRNRLLSFTALGILTLAVGWQRGLLFSQAVSAPAIEVDNGVRTVRVRFGVNDKEPTKWAGSATVTAGTILHILNWHPRPGDRVDNTGWSLGTAKALYLSFGRGMISRYTNP